jgi:DNA-binding NtrC family response regulator
LKGFDFPCHDRLVHAQAVGVGEGAATLTAVPSQPENQQKILLRSFFFMKTIREMVADEMPYDGIMNQLRFQVAVAALEAEKGNLSAAASRLNIHRNTFARNIETAGFTPAELLRELRRQNRVPQRAPFGIRAA